MHRPLGEEILMEKAKKKELTMKMLPGSEGRRDGMKSRRVSQQRLGVMETVTGRAGERVMMVAQKMT